MKTIFTLLSSLILSVGLFAAPIEKKEARTSTMLTIRSSDRADIRVVIDGRRFEPNRNFMRIQNLRPGIHRVKIYRQKTNGLFNIFGSRYEVVFNSSIHVKNNTQVMLSIDRYGRTSVRESRINGWNDRDSRYPNNRRFDEDDRNYPDYNDRDWNKGNDFDFDRDGSAGDYGNGRDDRNFNDNSYSRAMSDMEFSNVLRSIQTEWLEKNRAKSASQVISSGFFTSAQVRQLLQLFTFEDIKLDLAKQAYDKTVDQRNYGIVNDAFSFNSSREDLARHIRNYR